MVDISFATYSPIYGGAAGIAFTDSLSPSQKLNSITLNTESKVFSIQGKLNFGSLPYHGGTAGSVVSVSWPSDEYLVRTYGSYNATSSYVGQISFVTNKGRVLGPYGTPNYPTKTVITGWFLLIFPIYGSVPDYDTFDYTVPTNNAIAGFIGRASDVINAIGVTYKLSGTTLPTIATTCAYENGTCTLPAGVTAKIYYGANGNYHTKSGVTGSIACNNATFGDPAAGIGKNCSYVKEATVLPANSVACGAENSTCTLPMGMATSVYYGANGKYVIKDAVQGNIACNNATFGDPLPGTVKSCTYVNKAPIISAPDLSISIAQPLPVLQATAMSEVELRIDNLGADTSAPINVSFTLPTNVSAPLKFTRGADHWLCKTTGQTVACSYDKILANGSNTRLRIPVTPAATTLGTIPSPFTVSAAGTSGETNLSNNGPLSMTPTVAVAALALPSIADSLGIYSRPILDPTTIPKYALPLPNLLAPAYKHTANTTSAPGYSAYTLDIKKTKAQVLPPGYPATDVFAYGDPARPDSFSYPAHSIEARSTNPSLNTSGLGKPTKVQYQNTLTATEHVLDTVDPIIGTSTIVDRSLTGVENISVTNLREEIRNVAHLHGAKVVNQASNGYPEAWHSPTGQNGVGIPPNPTVSYNPNAFDYSNNQEASMLWYHDNAIGLTRLNVYAGLAGLYVVRDDNEMAMIANNQLPSGLYEVPLVLQDRMFHADGSFAYPDIDAVAPAPSWVKEFAGDIMVVNGVAWPYLQVEPRKYRFRVLNASNMRFYKLSLQNNAALAASLPFQVIGTDGGFLNAPTNTTSLTIAPGERYDIVVDFSSLNGSTLTLKNGAGTPFAAAGLAGAGGEIPPTAGLHDQLMEFRVNLPLSNAPSVALPTSLRTPIVPLNPTVATPRKLLMSDVINSFSRIKPLLGTASTGSKLWTDPITEFPSSGSVETWEIYNNTTNTHPIHINNGQFQVIERQPFNAVLGINGELSNITFPAAPTPAGAAESSWKDTVIVYPSPNNNPGTIDGEIVNGQVTRVRMKFENPGLFEWHCQIMEHQDHEMERPMSVLP